VTIPSKVDWSLEPVFVNNPSQTYFFGQHVVVGFKFRNLGSIPILLTCIVARFDWLSDGEVYRENRNTVYPPTVSSPFLAALEPPQFQIAYTVPPDIKPGHYKFRFGVEFSYLDDNEWRDVKEVQWAKNPRPISDRVLVTYPQSRAFSVFVSHSEVDRDLTMRVEDYIRRIGQQPYLAESPQNPDIGKLLFEEKINQAVQRANVVVLLWTGKSAMSNAVRYEINYGRKLGKRILVVLERGIAMPQELQGTVYATIDYGNEDEALRLVTRSLLQYEAEFRKQQQDAQAFGAVLALLALAYFTGKK
jgi:hypothetical protein